MNRLGAAFRAVFHLPAVWLALAVVALAIAINGSEPLADILRYALQRVIQWSRGAVWCWGGGLSGGVVRGGGGVGENKRAGLLVDGRF